MFIEPMNAASVYLVLCVIFWGWTFVATRICLQYVTPIELMGLRFLIGLPVLLVVVRAKRLKFSFTPQERRRLLLASGIITIHFFIQITGLKYTSATNTGWIIAVTPLVMAVAAYLFLKERLPKSAGWGIGVATAGILLLVSHGQVDSLGWLQSRGDWLVLASAHTWVLYSIVIRDLTRSKAPLVVTVAVLAPSAVLVLGYMSVTSDWTRFVTMPTDGLLAVVFLGLFGLALGHWFWQEGVARIGAARSGVFLYLEPLATTALAVPLLGEVFGLTTAAGGLLVLAGVYLSQRSGRGH